MNRPSPNLVLAGFMGTGKSTVGPLVARTLGRPFVDTDSLVERDAGMTIREIFATRGEPAFRALERQAVREAAKMECVVVSIGGGVLLDPENRRVLEAAGVIVLLTCERDVLVKRLEESMRLGERPLLGEDLHGRVDTLLSAREPVYSLVRLRVDTTHLAPEEVADAVLALYSEGESGGGHRVSSSMSTARRLPVRSPEGEYDIVLGRGLLDSLAKLAAEAGLGRRVVVVADTIVAPLYGDRVLASLQTDGFEASLAVMPAGEEHKTLDTVNVLVDTFVRRGLDRSGWVLTLGGGVVGDTAGFAAAVYMRGVPLVQVPTTLLAMADSSIGGKVGVDHPAGKNLLGAFKQPRLVVADLDTLATLPPEQIACGMAEIIKAGIIGDPVLFDLIERSDPGVLDYEKALRRAIEVKRGIVERDPHEVGERALLNLGHTFGHAFERCTGYTRLHGYAVSQGIAVAFRLAAALGMCDRETGARVEAVLEKWGLPVHWGLNEQGAVEQVWQAMASDKKRRDGKLRLVLPEAIGKVRLVEGVPEAAIKQALMEMQ